MKVTKKIATLALSAALLMSVSVGSASAKWGWGDTWDDAIQIYSSGHGDSVSSSTIDNTSDNDWYVINNSSGSEFDYVLSLKSPAGLNYDLQLVKVDSNGSIVKTIDVYDNGSGGTDAIGATVQAGYKVYAKVHSHGANDFGDQSYTLKFSKRN